MEQDKVSTTDWEEPLEEVEDADVFEQRIKALPSSEITIMLQKMLEGVKTLAELSDGHLKMKRYMLVRRRSWELEYRNLLTVEDVHEKLRMNERVWQASVALRERWGGFVEGNLSPEEKCKIQAHNVEQKAMSVRAQEIRQKSQNS